MGAPELPGDPVEDLRPTEPIEHVLHASDESENETDDYEGYEPLAVDDFVEENVETNADENMEAATLNPMESNLPTIERAEIEIEREIWNAPRPQVNQIELDTTKTAQILSAMSSITLPNITLPDWAVNVPEERWKEELLQRIRQRKDAQQTQQTSTGELKQ